MKSVNINKFLTEFIRATNNGQTQFTVDGKIFELKKEFKQNAETPREKEKEP